MPNIKIAAVAVSENIVSRSQRIEWLLAAVKEAKGKGASAVVFPEGCLSHRTTEGIHAYCDEKSARPMARKISHPDIAAFRDAAKKHRLTVLLNTEELDKGKVFNTTFFFSSKGELLGRYRKHFLPPGEAEVGFTPGEYMRPIKTPIGTIGCLICWEIHFPEVCVRHLVEGANLFIWQTMPFGEMPMSVPARVASRAADLASPFLVVTYALPDERASMWDGISTMAADSFGRIIGSAPQKPGVYVFDVNPDEQLRFVPWGEPPEKWQDRKALIADARRKAGIIRRGST